MATPIKITIPTPCHEDWANMTPADRGRFCNACQKTVIDFTLSTDREIVTAYNRNAKLCGRFLPSQLERPLVIPKEKNTLWETGAAAIALLALGSTEALAQTTTDTIQHEVMGKFRTVDPNLKSLSGTVVDEDDLPLPGVTITRRFYTDFATSDLEGNFSIQAASGDTLVFESVGYETYKLAVDAEDVFSIKLNPQPETMDGVIVIGYRTQKQSYTIGAVTTIKAEDLQVRRRTFFGRIFYTIGNIFR